MFTKRITFAGTAALAAGLLLAGCGAGGASSSGPDATVGTTASPAAPSTPVGSSTAAGAASPTAADQPGISAKPYAVVDGRGTVVENADGTRTVTSTWGTATVPADPQRIVSILGYVDFETMLALGVIPVAAGTQGGSATSGFAAHLTDAQTAGITPLPWLDGAPVEQIAALQPDLIFAPTQESYDAVKELAPTVPAGAADAPTWQDDARYIGAVLGQGAQVEGLLADYDTEVAALKAKLAPALGDKTVASFLVAFDGSGLLVSGAKDFSTQVLSDLGATVNPGFPVDDVYGELSFEQLDDLTADVLFLEVGQGDTGEVDSSSRDLVEANPLWTRLSAVKSGDVHQVNNRPWYFPTILSAHQIMKDVETALLN